MWKTIASFRSPYDVMYGIYIYIYRERVVVWKTETSKQIKKMLPLLSSELAALPSTFRSLFGYEIKKTRTFRGDKSKELSIRAFIHNFPNRNFLHVGIGFVKRSIFPRIKGTSKKNVEANVETNPVCDNLWFYRGFKFNQRPFRQFVIYSKILANKSSIHSRSLTRLLCAFRRIGNPFKQCTRDESASRLEN